MIDKWLKVASTRKAINLKIDGWKNNKTTNCYAFALGLDVPSKEICNFAYAYNGGYLYLALSIWPIDIRGLGDKAKIELDFKILRLYYEQIGLYDQVRSPYEWKIAFFEDIQDGSDFHFFRQAENGIWYHKYGKEDAPTCYDEAGKLITDPINAELNTNRYAYRTCYRLSKRRLK